MFFIPLCGTAGVLSVVENVRFENLEAKIVLAGRSCFYHFNDHTYSKKLRVLTNRIIMRMAATTGKNSQMSIRSFGFHFLHS